MRVASLGDSGVQNGESLTSSPGGRGRARSLVYHFYPIAALGLLLAVLLLAGPGPLSAPASAADDRPPVLSAAEVDYPPFSLVDEQGEATGFSVELLRAALAAVGRKVTFRTGIWADVRSWLETGQVQVLPLVDRTPERERLYDFTFPYMTLHGAIVVRADDTAVQTLDDLRGRRVAVMRGDNAEEFLRRAERGFDIYTTPTFVEALNGLAAGTYDAVVIQRLLALRLMQELHLSGLRVVDRPVEGFSQDFCFAVKEGDSELLALLNEGLALVIADGTYRRLHAKWFATLELPTNRRIVVGGDDAYPPVEFLDEKGRPAGYNVDLTWAIARTMGLDVEIRLGPWAEMRAGLERGDIDVLQGMLYSPERDELFDFSQPHTVNYYVCVTRKGAGAPPGSVEDLQGKTIVVQNRDMAHDFLLKQGLGAQVATVDSHREALRAVAQGLYDCALVSRITAQYEIRERGMQDELQVGKTALFTADYCYAVREGQTALLAAFAEGLRLLKESGEYHEIYQRWLGVYEQPKTSALTILRYVAYGVGPLLLLLAAAVLWTRSLRRQVAKRTEDLRLIEFGVDNMSDLLLWVDREGRFVRVSESVCRRLGYTREELLSMRVTDIDVDPPWKSWDEHWQELKEKGTLRFETRHRTKTGEVYPVELTVTYLEYAGRELNVAFGRDITERKRMEREREITAQALEQMGVGMMRVDREGRIRDVNEHMCRMLGYSRSELLSLHVWEVAVENTPESWPARWEELRRRKTWTFERLNRTKSGELITVEVSSSIVEFEGEEFNHALIRDISERKQVEAALRERDEQLRQAQKMEAIGRLAGGIAHDFNNLLTAIIGYSDLVLSDPKFAESPWFEDVREIRKAAERAGGLTQQILAFSRRQVLQPKVVSMNEIIAEALPLLRRTLGEDIELVVELEPTEGLVEVDPHQFTQVLMNLAVNARDAMPIGGRLVFATAAVHLDKPQSLGDPDLKPGEYVRLTVSDTGVGMDTETLARVFEPFFTTKAPGQGTGLGLPTAYGIIKQSGGTIVARSVPGEGSTFEVYLPRVKGPVAGTQEPAATPGGTEETTKILLVEDEDSLRDLVERMLVGMGHTVVAAANGAEALTLLQAHPDVDLLVTDVVLPGGMNGADVARAVRGSHPRVEVLFISGYPRDVSLDLDRDEAALHYLEKPFTAEELAAKLQEMLAGRTQHKRP
jgi:PAS domain S-box-containing protein